MNRLKNIQWEAVRDFDHVGPCMVAIEVAPKDQDFDACAGRAICYAAMTNAPVRIQTACGSVLVLPESKLDFIQTLFWNMRRCAELQAQKGAR